MLHSINLNINVFCQNCIKRLKKHINGNPKKILEKEEKKNHSEILVNTCHILYILYNSMKMEEKKKIISKFRLDDDDPGVSTSHVSLVFVITLLLYFIQLTNISLS